MKGEHTIGMLCRTLRVSESGYYRWSRNAPSKRAVENQRLEERIREAHERSRGTYGSVRIAHALGCPGAHNRIARLMRRCALKGRQRARYLPRTTDSNHSNPIAPNLLANQDAPTRVNEVWSVDITYIRTGEGWLYLAGVMDMWSRKIVGWSMQPSLHTSLALDALHMALQTRKPTAALLHHSDRGGQYASREYRNALKTHRIEASMSRKANCYDNASMESCWSTLKMEMVYRTRFETHAQARVALFEYIECFYNRTRLHSSLGYKSPLDFENSIN